MFKKPAHSKKIRRKILAEGDEDDQDTTVVQRTASKKSTKKGPKPTIGLSFDDNVEAVSDDTFQIKKSKASLRMSAGRELKLPDSNAEAESTSSATSYSAEMLASLRSETPSLPSSYRAGNEPEKASDSMDGKLSDIPTASMISAAKKKRELLRKGVTIMDDDYVSLNERDDDSDTKREDMDTFITEDDPEYENFVDDHVSLSKREAKQREKDRKESVKEMIEEAQNEDTEEEDEDVERWEQDLIRHGTFKRQERTSEHDPFAPPINYRPAIVPEPSKLPSLTDFMNQLDLKTNELTEHVQFVKTQTTESQKQVEREWNLQNDLEVDIERNSRRYDYFQNVSRYVNDLGEFLDEKIPKLEALEKEAHDVISSSVDTIVDRRWWDDLDDLVQFTVIPEDAMNDQDQDTHDEFGRAPERRHSEPARQRRRQLRQERFERWCATSSSSKEDTTVEQQEGFWSDDDEDENAVSQQNEKLAHIQTEKLQELCADADNDFALLSSVMRRFESWKTDFREDFDKAYGSLSLPGAFDFHVRCELLRWNLFKDPIEFDSMQWHQTLSSFAVTNDEHHAEEVDVEMINKVVEKTVIRKIKSMLDTLDIMSSKAMRRTDDVLEHVSYYLEKDNRVYQELVLAVEETLAKKIERYTSLLDTTMPRTHSLVGSEQAKRRFAWRQCKVIKNLRLLRRHVPRDHLEQLGRVVVDRIVAPILQTTQDAQDAALQGEALVLLEQIQV